MSKTNHPAKKDMPVQYDSNPFTLTFNALGRFFNTNVNWAIVIIAFVLIGFIGQTAVELLRLMYPDQPTGQSSEITPLTTGASPDATVVIAVIVVIFSLLLVFAILATIFSAFINGMFSYVALQSEAGKTTGFSEAFNATKKRFWRLLFAQLLANLKIFGWTLLFIIPGIVAGYRYQLLPYLIMNESDKEKGIGDSHNKTKALVKGRLWELFGISFVAGIVPFVGSLLSISGNAAYYNQLQATAHEPEKRPKIHWLNYIGLILGATVLLFAFLILVLIILVALAVSGK